VITEKTQKKSPRIFSFLETFVREAFILRRL